MNCTLLGDVRYCKYFINTLKTRLRSLKKKRHDTSAYLLFQWENFFSAFLTASCRSAWPVSGALDCLAVTLFLSPLFFFICLFILFLDLPLSFLPLPFSLFLLALLYHLPSLSFSRSLSLPSFFLVLPLLFFLSTLHFSSYLPSFLASISASLPPPFLFLSLSPSFSPPIPPSLSSFLTSISPPLPSSFPSPLAPSLLPAFILPFLSSLSSLPPPPFSLSSLHLALDGRHSNRRQRWHCSLFSLPPRAPPAFLCSVLFIVPGIFMCF